ncbi:hypothetical protein ON064_00400 [Planococcus sp. A6]|uniref:hypothetical protein n=1 Tax=Planococcus sp. A6 TaxID=2992760 RepID=UPI00237B7DB0|nr:hypothetical protein [Planococcus sp. A6]MDE0581509.1 hypothetical protein [Planococcus sp. A6]
MEHKIFHDTTTKLVEIEKTKPFNGGTWTDIWNWDISIAVYKGETEDTFKGRAIEAKRGVVIPWMEISSDGDYSLSEMIEECKKYMGKH